MPGKIQPTNPKLEAVPDVVIDDNGKFKYIQCKIYDPDKTEDWKYIVRGSNRAEFHCKHSIIMQLYVKNFIVDFPLFCVWMI